MSTFIAVYHGDSVASAKLIAVTADPGLIAQVSGHLLRQPEQEQQDPVVARLERGRRSALRLISKRVSERCPT